MFSKVQDAHSVATVYVHGFGTHDNEYDHYDHYGYGNAPHPKIQYHVPYAPKYARKPPPPPPPPEVPEVPVYHPPAPEPEVID